jgi:hypothetical protein
MKHIFTLVFAFLSSSYFSQTVIMGDAGFTQANPIDCNTFGITGTNFQDPGGTGNYLPNFNDTTVFCPDLTLGTKVTLTFAINVIQQTNHQGECMNDVTH